MNKISVVLPIYSRHLGSYFWHIVQQFGYSPQFELLIIDGVAQTNHYISDQLPSNAHYHTVAGTTRGQRLTIGIQQAQHRYILLHHPRSLLSVDGLAWLREANDFADWQTFSHRFDDNHPFLTLLSWYSNHVRVDRKHIVYLDHCMLIKQTLLSQIELNNLAIFEDTALSQQLHAHSQPHRLPFTVTTSAIRFRRRGIYQHFCLNQCLKVAFAMGVNNALLNRWYEQTLNLNQQN